MYTAKENMFKHNPLILIVSDRVPAEAMRLISNIEYYDATDDNEELEFCKRQWHLASLKKDKRNMRIWQKRINEIEYDQYG
jgi:hypothetical protein